MADSRGPSNPFEAVPVGPDHPAVQLFAQLDALAESLLSASLAFSEVAADFARQVRLAKAVIAARADEEGLADG